MPNVTRKIHPGHDAIIVKANPPKETFIHSFHRTGFGKSTTGLISG